MRLHFAMGKANWDPQVLTAQGVMLRCLPAESLGTLASMPCTLLPHYETAGTKDSETREQYP